MHHDQDQGAPAIAEDPDRSDAVLLTEPRDGLPPVVDTPAALSTLIDRFAAGTGPVAVDAERASGFRYTGRAYLIQLRRTGAGTALIDPIPFTALRELAEAVGDTEWILHAASQDLPCLADLGMRPALLFDTELAARLCGFERVGLATLTENLLGFALEKHHSASDWSTRPLPEAWLNYAALDVELLVELREVLDAELIRQGKREWAAQEFAAVAVAPPPAPRPDPWRRTSGIHKVRGARALARVRQLWQARDRLASRMDRAPSKVLPDAAIVDAAMTDPTDVADLLALPGFRRRHGRDNAKLWLRALAEVRRMDNGELPTPAPPNDGPPSPHRWAERNPDAAQRLARAKAAIGTLATEHRLPPENLLTPATVRAVAWQPPARLSPASLGTALTEHGARPWQVELAAGPLSRALRG